MTSRFDVDDAAVAQASQQLGVTLPVRVFKRRYAHATGNYLGIRDGAHRIGVHCELASAEASRVLWHELTHAAQAERLGGSDAFDRRRNDEVHAAGLTRQDAARAEGARYEQMPLEREALANERRHRQLHLTRRTRPRTAAPYRLMIWLEAAR
jgi:hypothetical protein